MIISSVVPSSKKTSKALNTLKKILNDSDRKVNSQSRASDKRPRSDVIDVLLEGGKQRRRCNSKPELQRLRQRGH